MFQIKSFHVSSKSYKISMRAGIMLVASLMITGPGLYAHEMAEGIQKERQMAMDSLKQSMKTIGMSLRGDLDAEAIKKAAQTIQDVGANMVAQFPDTAESKAQDFSDALPSIWDNFDRFTQLANDLEKAGINLADATNGDRAAIANAFKGVGQACKACHMDYRAE